MVSISGFRTDEMLKLAQERLLTILIGASVCVIVCIFVCPVWAGEDLHKFVAQNIGKLGSFLEGIYTVYHFTHSLHDPPLHCHLDRHDHNPFLD